MSKNTPNNNPSRLIPENESSRLKILEEYHIMDTLPEKQFDDITRLASLICETPITLISLLDEGRQWFKSKQGMEVSETPREISFCQYTILGSDIFEVQNSLQDERFAENPLVTGDPNIRFYAGAPLIAPEGHNIGTLCVIDTKPNKLDDKQREALAILANEVVINLELRKERERIEEERKKAYESNALLNAFLEHSPSYISLRDLDGEYLLANKATLQNINKSRDEVIGFRLHDLFGKEVSDQVTADDKEVVASGVGTMKEYTVGTPEDPQYYIRHMFPVFNSEGEVYGVGAISNNITESKKLQREIQLSNERFSAIFYGSPIGILIADVETSEFIMVNNTFTRVFGYEPDEVVGKTSEELNFLVSPEQRAEVTQLLEKTGRLSNVEFEVCKKDGEIFTSLCSVEVVNVGGRAQVITAFQDITERKKMEMKLEDAKQEAEASTLAKSTFLANMSHEIRTPLNAMLGFSNLMAKTVLNDVQREYLDAIETSGRNLLGIINDILDFSKIEAGMFTIETVPFSIQQSLHSVNTMFFEEATRKGLKLFISIDPKTPTLVKGDPTRLNQVMINLIGNAIKFTNAGTVKIEASILQRTENTVKMQISVRDTGIGIAADKLRTIFDRFTQAEDNTTRKFGGTGLGLTIAKKLVEIQGGVLWVNSELNKGSEFGFTIEYPISESPEYAHTEIASKTEHIQSNGKRILIVEDNVLNQKLASTLLKNEGFEVEVAANGQIAVDRLKSDKFDLILMDIQMPVMDGYETTAELRINLNIKSPIVAMTANALAGEREKCLAIGMNDYITKPFKTQDLLDVIGKLVG